MPAIDLGTPVERLRLLIFAPTFLMKHAFCQTESMLLFSFLFLLSCSTRPEDRLTVYPSHIFVCLLVSRCVSRGNQEGGKLPCADMHAHGLQELEDFWFTHASRVVERQHPGVSLLAQIGLCSQLEERPDTSSSGSARSIFLCGT
jgi:hypothetical protein